MAEAPLGASPPSCFIGTPFISCGSHFSHKRFSHTVIATSRIPTSPINAPVTAGGAYPPVQRAHCRQTQQLYIHLPERPRTPFLISLNSNVPGTPSVYNSGRNRFQRLLYRFRPVQRAHYAISRELYTHRRRNPARFLRCIPFACRTAPRARNEPSVGVNEIRNTTGLSSTIVEPHRHD